MDLYLGILGGVSAMLAWGSGDFIAAIASRKFGSFKVTFWSQLASLIFYLLFFFIFFNFKQVSLNSFIFIILSSICTVVTFLSFYKGLEVGQVAIISPISSGWSIVTLILSFIFLKQQLSGIQTFAVILAICGGISTSFKWRDLKKINLKNPAKGLGYALVVALTSGVFFIFIDLLKTELGWFLPLVLIRFLSTVILFFYLFLTKKDLSLPKENNAKLWFFLIGGFEFLALVSYSFGIKYQFTALVNPISSAFPMITVMLSSIFLKEKLDANQAIGIGAVILALVLIAI